MKVDIATLQDKTVLPVDIFGALRKGVSLGGSGSQAPLKLPNVL